MPLISDLENLSRLYRDGVLTAQEFANAKRAVLQEESAAPPQPLNHAPRPGPTGVGDRPGSVSGQTADLTPQREQGESDPTREKSAATSRRLTVLVGGVLAVVMFGLTFWVTVSATDRPKRLVNPSGKSTSLVVGGPGVEIHFCWVPPGRFRMGSWGGEDTRPERWVTISKGFWMGQTEVTQAQWRAVMNTDRSWVQGPDLPANGVTWYDATAFCQSLSAQTNRRVRLPTEAEWEYGCRAGTTTEYYGGNGEDALRPIGWYYGNNRAWYRLSNEPTLRPVGRLAPNQWGLYDMHGNVGEWCQDWYGLYSPVDQTDPTGPADGTRRVFRGGGYNSTHERCQATCRDADEPLHRMGRGFRVCYRDE